MAQIDIADLKTRVPLTSLIGETVKLTRRGREYVGLCPFHNEKTPSFTVSDNKGFFHCFGCGEHGDAIDFMQKVHDMSAREAIDHLAAEAGLAPSSGGRKLPGEKLVPMTRPTPEGPDVEEKGKQKTALRIWGECLLIENTLAEVYLRHRGITITSPASIRFHPGLTHQPSGIQLPAMVAAVEAADRRVVAIHRTFLRLDGQGKAGVRVPKMALGPFGQGAVRLGPAGPVLALAEGIESGLSAAQLFDLPVWCAIGSRLDRIKLPIEVVELHIFGDADAPGRDTAARAAKVFTSQGRRVFLRFPPDGLGDFNDMLRAEVAA